MKKTPIFGNSLKYLTLFLSLAILLSACSSDDKQYYSGYIEGEYRFIAAPASGWLTLLPWQVGDYIQSGKQAFTLDDNLQTLALVKAKALVLASRGRLYDLQQGKRPVVIDALIAKQKALKAKLIQAETDAKRYTHLAKKGAIAQQQADHEQNMAAQLREQFNALTAEIKAAQLPARQGQIMSAEAELTAAQNALTQAHEKLKQRTIYSAFDGRVDALYAHTGEWIAMGQPVIKILPSNARKVIFFIPEHDYAHFHIGDNITVSGDGVSTQQAKISFISDQAIFTPPVIYSEVTRSKLVFRLEAQFTNSSLPVGLPVSVSVYE